GPSPCRTDFSNVSKVRSQPWGWSWRMTSCSIAKNSRRERASVTSTSMICTRMSKPAPRPGDNWFVRDGRLSGEGREHVLEVRGVLGVVDGHLPRPLGRPRCRPARPWLHRLALHRLWRHQRGRLVGWPVHARGALYLGGAAEALAGSEERGWADHGPR